MTDDRRITASLTRPPQQRHRILSLAEDGTKSKRASGQKMPEAETRNYEVKNSQEGNTMAIGKQR